MNRTTWTIQGEDQGWRLVEVRAEGVAGPRMSYREAKERLITSLQQRAAPILGRIATLEADEDAEAGALPPLKAWTRKYEYSYNTVIVAPTKKRAIELAYRTRYSFDQDFEIAEGDWWYRVARQGEGVWVEERDEEKQGTGVYYRPVERSEADQIVEQHLAAYSAMPIERLVAEIGAEYTITGESSFGTPYRLVTQIRACDWKQNHVSVTACLNDCLNWWPSGSHSTIHRELPKLTCDWEHEGF